MVPGVILLWTYVHLTLSTRNRSVRVAERVLRDHGRGVARLRLAHVPHSHPLRY